jgi:hypothetical protein
MSTDAAAAEVSPCRPLAPAAVGHLAHDLRGAIHVIRGHADLLRAEATDAETRESAGYIVDASTRLAGLFEDLIDMLRLPALGSGEPRELALAEIGLALAPVADDRGVLARILGPERTANLLVRSSVRRIVSNLLDHVVRVAVSDIAITAARRRTDASGSSSCTIAVEPVPVGFHGDEDGIVALAEQLLVAHGGDLQIFGSRMELVVPVEGELRC